jgi:transposase InsO family protein
MVSVQARRDAVAFATTRGVSQRRACTLLDVARSALGYCSRLAVKDAPALKRMVELSLQYPRYGYRRIAIYNGPEFVSRALLKWIVDQGIETALIDPGKPWQNGTPESFNGKFRIAPGTFRSSTSTGKCRPRSLRQYHRRQAGWGGAVLKELGVTTNGRAYCKSDLG